LRSARAAPGGPRTETAPGGLEALAGERAPPGATDSANGGPSEPFPGRGAWSRTLERSGARLAPVELVDVDARAGAVVDVGSALPMTEPESTVVVMDDAGHDYEKGPLTWENGACQSCCGPRRGGHFRDAILLVLPLSGITSREPVIPAPSRDPGARRCQRPPGLRERLPGLCGSTLPAWQAPRG
jgi:hypothetical protein